MSALPPDLHALTGSYVLNALDADERALFDAHLAQCQACQDEVAELSRAASSLAKTVQAPVPSSLRASVLDTIADTRQRAPVTPLPLRSRALQLRRITAVAAGLVLIAATGSLSVLVTDLRNQVEQLEQAADMASRDSDVVTRILGYDDMMMVESVSESAQPVRVMMSASHGEGVLLTDGMPAAPKDHAYTLWMVHHDGTITPAGLVSPYDSGQVVHPFTGQLTTASALQVTIEPVGANRAEPTGTTVMQLDLTRPPV